LACEYDLYNDCTKCRDNSTLIKGVCDPDEGYYIDE